MFSLIFVSSSKKIINKYIKKFLGFLVFNGFYISSIVSMPIKRHFFSILRSPHIDKNSRDQFEYREYKKLIILKNVNRVNIKKIIGFNIPSSIKMLIKL